MHARLLWLGLGVALSPSLMELARHWLAEPWSRYAALFVPLWIACARADTGPARPRPAGHLLLALGVAWAAIAVGGGMGRFGRPGIALAVVGLAAVLGRPSLARALLAAFAIPVPSAILDRVPGVERISAALVAGGADALGLALAWRPALEGVELVAGGGQVLALGPENGGLPLAALLAGLGWYAAAREGASPRQAARAAVRRAAWAIGLQPLAIVVAGGLLLAGAPGLAKGMLQTGLWLVVAAVSLRQIHGGAPAGRGLGTAPLRAGEGSP